MSLSISAKAKLPSTVLHGDDMCIYVYISISIYTYVCVCLYKVSESFLFQECILPNPSGITKCKEQHMFSAYIGEHML